MAETGLLSPEEKRGGGDKYGPDMGQNDKKKEVTKNQTDLCKSKRLRTMKKLVKSTGKKKGKKREDPTSLGVRLT